MTKNMEIAFNAAKKQVEECQEKIHQLIVLRDVYEKIDEDELKGLISNIKENDASFSIYGVFALVSQYPTLNKVNATIAWYEHRSKKWEEIRNQLGQD